MHIQMLFNKTKYLVDSNFVDFVAEQSTDHKAALVLVNAPTHDDIIKWKHFPRYWPFVWEIHRPPVNSPHKGQWRGALMFFFDLCLNKRLRKQSWGWWFETLSRPLWRHCNARWNMRYPWLSNETCSPFTNNSSFNKVSTTKWCTWHDSYIVVASAKLRCYMITRKKWNYKKKWNFYPIWILMENLSWNGSQIRSASTVIFFLLSLTKWYYFW